MTIGASLLSQIPMPKQGVVSQQPVASVKVGDIEREVSVGDEQGGNWLDKLKNKFIRYRMNKISQKLPEERTPVEQAEYEANLKSVDCMV